jgi:ketosteroid isomerase-like protein
MIGVYSYVGCQDTFFAYTKPGVFDIQTLQVVADQDVGFCYATMKCMDKSNSAEYVELEFRLTVGLRKINGQWTIVHEHHSVPSE